MNNLNEEKNGRRMYELNYLVELRHAEKIKEIARKIEGWIEKKKGELVETEKKETAEVKGGKSKIWIEKKRLAYPVRKGNSGYFLNSRLWLKPADVNDLKRFLRLEKEIARSFILTGENAAAPAPLRNAVPLSNMEQLEERGTEARRTEERAPLPAPRPKVEPEVRKELLAELETPAPSEEKVPEKPLKVEEKEVAAPREAEKPEAKPKKEPAEKKVKPTIEKEVPAEAEKPEKTERAGKAEEEKPAPDTASKEKEEKASKHKKITLEELDQRLDDILNEDIL